MTRDLRIRWPALLVIALCFACGAAIAVAARSGLSLAAQFGVFVTATASLWTLDWLTRRWDGFPARTMVLAMPAAAVAGVLLLRS